MNLCELVNLKIGTEAIIDNQVFVKVDSREGGGTLEYTGKNVCSNCEVRFSPDDGDLDRKCKECLLRKR